VASDSELIADVATGSEEAFRQLYDRFADRVYRYAYTILRAKHLAEEVSQETMIAVWKGASRFAGRSKASTWIFGIARNQAYSLVRKEIRTERVPDVSLVEPDPAPGIHRQEKVARALDRLSDDHREVVFLTFYEGLSYGEISSVLGIPAGTVKSRMFHAKKRLGEALA
jgi:RNA polymerase sigma-70 factor (ECF subfamily)